MGQVLEVEGDLFAECYMPYPHLGLGHLKLENPDLQRYTEAFFPPTPPQGAGEPWEAVNRGGTESARSISVLEQGGGWKPGGGPGQNFFPQCRPDTR